MNKKILATVMVLAVLLLSACGAVGPLESEGTYSQVESTQEQEDLCGIQQQSGEGESTENDNSEGETQEQSGLEDLTGSSEGENDSCKCETQELSDDKMNLLEWFWQLIFKCVSIIAE